MRRGGHKPDHFVKFRFTFTHVYIHASLNVNLQSFDLGLLQLIIYIRTSKLKPAKMESTISFFIESMN
jgi:hypothetical protein